MSDKRRALTWCRPYRCFINDLRDGSVLEVPEVGVQTLGAFNKHAGPLCPVYHHISNRYTQTFPLLRRCVDYLAQRSLALAPLRLYSPVKKERLQNSAITRVRRNHSNKTVVTAPLEHI
eukprot:4952776-Amphidinium_carterae.1